MAYFYRQGIHPWITGLSIIGGVYWTGIPGAIYGPLLLCAVYVILSMYTGVLKEIPLETTAAAGGLPGGGRSMMAVTPGAINHTLFLVLIFSRQIMNQFIHGCARQKDKLAHGKKIFI